MVYIAIDCGIHIMIKFYKAFKRIVGYPIYFLSGFIPRNANIWVFGSFGVFNDNSRYLYQYINENKLTNIKAIWISDNDDSLQEARQYGEAFHPLSIKGLYYSLIAKVYVHSNYLSTINFYTSRNALKVNLWHGVPLKKIEFDINTKPLSDVFKNASFLSKILRPHTQIKTDLLLSPSAFVTDYSYKSAFRLSEKNIIHAQQPRVTFLKNLMADKKEYSSYNKVFLYAPTWRDVDNDFFLIAGFDLDLLNKLMIKNNSLFCIKFHSQTKFSIDVSKFSNIQFLDNTIDPIKFMRISDCLITDYSSIFIDYLVLNKPIIYFCFDLDEYQNSREFYFNYDDIILGDKVKTFDSLIKSILNVLKDIDLYSEQRALLLDKFNDTENGNDYIINSIFNALKERV